MAVAVVQTSTGYQVATNVGSVTSSLTPASGNLLVAFLTVNNSTGAATMADANYTWASAIISTGGNLGPLVAGWVFVTTATANTLVSATGTYGLTAGTGGRSRLNIIELSGHNGYGVTTATFATAAATLLTVNIVTTSSGMAILTGHHSNTLETNLPATFSGLGSFSTSGPAIAFNWSYNATLGAAGTYAVQWGANPGTSMDRRRITVLEIIPAVTVTFNYNLLEHRVMRGAGRGLMRGVA